VSVMRFDPYREFDRLTQQMLSGSRERRAVSFPMDAYRRGDRFFVHVDLPGVDPDSIDLNVEQNVLTIQAERRYEPQEDDQLLVQERPQGTFSRQLFLSDALDPDQIQASYDQDEPELPVGARSFRGDRLDPLEGPLTPECGRIVGDPIEQARDQRPRAHGLVRAGDKPRAQPCRAASQRFSPTTSRFAFAKPSPRS
jgi:HSP20 family protein